MSKPVLFLVRVAMFVFVTFFARNVVASGNSPVEGVDFRHVPCAVGSDAATCLRVGAVNLIPERFAETLGVSVDQIRDDNPNVTIATCLQPGKYPKVFLDRPRSSNDAWEYCQTVEGGQRSIVIIPGTVLEFKRFIRPGWATRAEIAKNMSECNNDPACLTRELGMLGIKAEVVRAEPIPDAQELPIDVPKLLEENRCLEDVDCMKQRMKAHGWIEPDSTLPMQALRAQVAMLQWKYGAVFTGWLACAMFVVAAAYTMYVRHDSKREQRAVRSEAKREQIRRDRLERDNELEKRYTVQIMGSQQTIQRQLEELQEKHGGLERAYETLSRLHESVLKELRRFAKDLGARIPGSKAVEPEPEQIWPALRRVFWDSQKVLEASMVETQEAKNETIRVQAASTQALALKDAHLKQAIDERDVLIAERAACGANLREVFRIQEELEMHVNDDDKTVYDTLLDEMKKARLRFEASLRENGLECLTLDANFQEALATRAEAMAYMASAERDRARIHREAARAEVNAQVSQEILEEMELSRTQSQEVDALQSYEADVGMKLDKIRDLQDQLRGWLTPVLARVKACELASIEILTWDMFCDACGDFVRMFEDIDVRVEKAEKERREVIQLMVEVEAEAQAQAALYEARLSTAEFYANDIQRQLDAERTAARSGEVPVLRPPQGTGPLAIPLPLVLDLEALVLAARPVQLTRRTAQVFHRLLAIHVVPVLSEFIPGHEFHEKLNSSSEERMTNDERDFAELLSTMTFNELPRFYGYVRKLMGVGSTMTGVAPPPGMLGPMPAARLERFCSPEFFLGGVFVSYGRFVVSSL
jgi:hypothetical protein